MATRNFKLIGRTYSDDAACTITLNGIEVFSGSLLQEFGDELPICVGSAEVGDDSAEVTLPVSITMTAGTASFGMLQFNYKLIINPALTPEESAYNGVPIDEIPAEIKSSVSSKGGFMIGSADAYDYGDVPVLCADNRSNVLINGLPSENPDYSYQLLGSGQTLTFDQTIFARP